MEFSYFTSFSLGIITLIIIYIFNWYKFRSNLNFLVSKFFECCCPCCCKKSGIEKLKEEGDGKNLSEIILEKVGLLIRTHVNNNNLIQVNKNESGKNKNMNNIDFIQINENESEKNKKGFQIKINNLDLKEEEVRKKEKS